MSEHRSKGTCGRLYFGDNLDILRNHIPDESVDLIYIDPPFNSNQAYNVIFSEADGASSQAQIQAFGDTWHWAPETEAAYEELIEDAPTRLAETIRSFRGFLGENNLMAYLVMMAVRLVELHRVLKPTGSFYLHCDPTASHYLKIILDQIFGVENFKNEIIWQRTESHNTADRYGNIADILLYYTKSDTGVWNRSHHSYSGGTQIYSDQQLKRFHHVDENGRRYKLDDLTAPRPNSDSGKFEWRGTMPGRSRGWGYRLEQLEKWWTEGRIHTKRDGTPRMDGLKVYLDESEGKPLQNIWTDIPRISNTSTERLGFPTQKPIALLERIISVSSNEGAVVLDAFCGCGTTIAAAQKLNRRWIGIDITYLAISLIEYRLTDTFGSDAKYEVIGIPKDQASARDLSLRDRYQFQWWALSLIRARPYQGKKKGADQGVDGLIYFQDIAPENPKKKLTQKIVVQVKSGQVSVRDIRELKTVVENQDGVIGVFITLREPTRPMVTEAATAGTWKRFAMAYPKIQIRTIKELLDGNGIEYPQTPVNVTFRKAEQATRSKQFELEVF